jgi:uncharacterized protein (TIGR02271 family)
VRQGTGNAAVHEQRVLPLAREEVKIGKRRRVTGVTRVKKVVRESVTIADEPLQSDEVVVERVPVNEYIDGPRSVREVRGTTIIPVMEEVVHVEKRLLLKEEVRITRSSRTVHRPQRVVVRREEAIVERGAGEHEEKQRRPPVAIKRKGG